MTFIEAHQQALREEGYSEKEILATTRLFISTVGDAPRKFKLATAQERQIIKQIRDNLHDAVYCASGKEILNRIRSQN